MAVVLLTNNSNRGQTLAHLIVRAGLDLKLVVVEDASLRGKKGNPIINVLRATLGGPYRWLKKMLFLKPADRKALDYESQSIAKANKLVNDYIRDLNVYGRPDGIEYLETPSLNEASVITAVNRAEPDVCVVLGTSIIRERLISIPKVGMINAHTSILPE